MIDNGRPQLSADRFTGHPWACKNNRGLRTADLQTGKRDATQPSTHTQVDQRHSGNAAHL
jgi:hypothetical protein